MTMPRWRFTDPKTSATYVVPLNPNSMSDPPMRPRSTQAQASSVNAADLVITRGPSALGEWKFSGVIRTSDHHDDLIEWFQKDYVIQVRDHFSRTFSIKMLRFEVVERRPTRLNADRYTYTATALVMA